MGNPQPSPKFIFILKIDINMDAVQRLNGSWHYIIYNIMLKI